MIPKLKRFDAKLIKIINYNMKSKFMDRFMLIITNLSSVLFIGVFVSFLIIFGDEKTSPIGIEIASTLAISQTITYGLKNLLGRERPYNKLKNLNTFGIILKDYSFPSGHSSASFSIASIIAFNMPPLSILVVALALAVGISRIYLGVHYPTDVLAGIIIGVGAAIVVHGYLIANIYKLISIY